MSGSRPVRRPPLADWLAAAGWLLGGIGLFWGLARFGLFVHELLAGWCAMFGLVMMLHFGLFHGLALFWQSLGIRAEPIMNSPLSAKSPSEFWRARWNRAFLSVSGALVPRGLRHRIGNTGVILAPFIVSGALHELVISIPAGGGWGLPTTYFTLQGAAVLFERSRGGRRLRIDQGTRGRLFALIVVGAPAFWLFHPPFVIGVVLPMMRALGALN